MSPRILKSAVTIAVGALGVLSLTAAAAQDARSVLAGRVVDEAGAPMAGVEVSVTGSSAGRKTLEATTDASGTFEIPVAANGLYSLGIRSPGRYPIAELLQSAAGTPRTGRQYVLEKVVVGEDTDSTKLYNKIDATWTWQMRRNSSAVNAARHGFVIGLEDIETQRPNWTSDLLFNTQGFRVIGNGAAARVVGSRARCMPVVFINGLEAGDFRVNDIPPSDIELLVLFRGSTAVPSQFRLARDTRCGLIAVYTL